MTVIGLAILPFVLMVVFAGLSTIAIHVLTKPVTPTAAKPEADQAKARPA